MRTTLRRTYAALLCLAFYSYGKTVDSGSNGSDGELILNTPGVVFLGQDSTPANKTIFNFTSITIGAGVTVKLSSKNLHGPVFWLASGPVQIDGTIDLNGDDTQSYSSGASRVPSISGAGGYGGGVGATNAAFAQSGLGPFGGAPSKGGAFTGNKLLVPLSGGSGGGGTATASGGGGGGALLIASSSSITLNGTISANGGNQTDPGFLVTGGAGGGIRLVAPIITGSGALLTAKGGIASGGAFSGADGSIRLEADDNTLRGDINGTPFSIGKPFKLFLPADAPPSVTVLSIGNSTIGKQSGTGSVMPLEATKSTGPVQILLEAKNIPPGTKLKIHFYSETGEDLEAESTKLSGTFDLSYATVSATLPPGLTHVVVDSAWPNKPARVANIRNTAKMLALPR